MTANAIAKLRLPQAAKTAYQGAARRAGKTFSAFVRQACDQAVTGFDTGAIRADLAAMRRHLNLIASYADGAAQGGLDGATARRLSQEAAALRAILDRHLALVRS